MDITGSWSRPNMRAMSTGLVAALDALVDKSVERGAPGDSVALVAYYGRYAYTLTPWTDLGDATAVSAARDTWAALEVASRGGTPREYPEECVLAPDSPVGAESARDEFPTGGCYPHMPREYTDESGTDHTVGLTLAETQFMALDQGSRALVLVTDGVASALASTNGSHRVTLGYSETRWEEYQGPVPHTSSEINAETPALAQVMHDNLAVDTWALTLIAAPDWMDTFATGRGTTAQLGDAAEFEAALLGIVGEL